ncbi:hypothetical protein BT96DRAFT_913889 [Gymnopus androsaceus JB14]|uniref:Uncharacterized protein n=1 Tax=Gymnopus androsaceus JB14 TaxID=1447944 RepID=A0A6A4IDX6_9AGAR|nr:hypothetical protein BT96DRAFT_913889 [Gymnopus androsaceus JB14]
MSQYLSQTRIEEQIWLEPSDIFLLRNRIFEAESQLESLESQISELTRQRDAKLVDIAACRNVLSPIRRVPLEILAEIFDLSCRPKVYYAGHNIIRSTSVLSRVCVAWRNAAHATPRLWSNLCISASNHPKVFNGQFGWLKEWVDRCQGRSLDLYLDLRADKSPELFFHSILRFSHKIRLLNISGPPSSYLPLIDHSSFPLLEEVDFELNDIPDADGTVELVPAQKIDALLGAPKLRCARMTELTELSLLTVLMLPAEQLTSLKIISDFHSYNIYVNLLHRCGNLVNLELDYDSELHPIDNTSLPIYLPSLKSLSLCDNLVGWTTAPHLEELTLRYVSRDFLSFSMEVAAFQRRSRTALSTLYLEYFDPLDEGLANFTEDLIAVLSVFPTVSKFGIWYSTFDVNPLLRALTVDENRQALLPKLEHLSLRMYFGSADYTSELTALILSRWWPEVIALLRLQNVTLGGNSGLKKLDMTSVPSGLIVLEFRLSDLAYM